jgi:hypothetical protein
MQYLTFECFDENVSPNEMRKFLLDGHYAFLDYASLHWLHHLEIATPSLKSDDLRNSADLGIAINEFFEMYGPGTMEANKEQNDYAQKYEAIENSSTEIIH